MESFIKNIKKKLSVDNLVDMMKDSKVLDENAIKEEDVRQTLQKLDPNSLMDVEEIAAKLNEISEEANQNKTKAETSASKKIMEAAKSSIGALQKPTIQDDNPNADSEYLRALGREENVFKLYDDF